MARQHLLAGRSSLEDTVLGTYFVILCVAHVLADYPGQTDHQAAHKADRTAAGWLANLTHAATHMAITLALLGIATALNQTDPSPAGLAAALAWVGVSHSFIDRRWAVRWWMEHAGQTGFMNHGGAAHVDQAAHLGLGLLPAALVLAAF